MSNSAQSFTIFKKVNQQEKLVFTKHISVMLKAGLPVTEVLETLASQTRSSYFKEVLTAVLSDVKNGKSLADSFRKHPRWFDDFYISLIEIGETSGTLVDNLEFLVDQLVKSHSLKKKVRSALIYPGLVLSLALVVGSFISFFILPRLVDFFESFEIDLPFSTKVLLFMGTTMRDYGIVIFLGLAGVLILTRFAIQLPRVKPYWHAVILKIPVIGELVSYSQLAQFSRNLGTLLQSGTPIIKALEVTADTLSNIQFRRQLLSISSSLAKGKDVGRTMENIKFSKYPPLVSRMVAVGEKTGKLDETLLYLAVFYEDEVDDISKNLGSVIEPVLLIAIGLFVGFLALSIISPIYELTGSIRR